MEKRVARLMGGLVLGLFFIISLYAVRVLAASCPLTPLRPYKTSLSNAVYYISSDCKKRPIKNPDVFFSHFSSWKDVRVALRYDLNRIPDHELSFLPWGTRRSYGNGSLVKTVDDPLVYLVIDGQAYPLESEKVFYDLGLSWSWVEDVVPTVIKKFNITSPVTSTDNFPSEIAFGYDNSPDVFVLERDASGNLIKRIVTSVTDLSKVYRLDRIPKFSREQNFADGLPFAPSLSASTTQMIAVPDTSSTSTAHNTVTSTPTSTPHTNSDPIVSGGHTVIDTPVSSSSGSSSATGTVDLSLAMSVNVATTTPSTTVLFTLSYRNFGTGSATGVTITNVVPTNTLFSSVSSTGTWSCANRATAGTSCSGTIGTLAPGATSSIIFALTPTSSFEGSVTNTASISDDGSLGADLNSANNSASSSIGVSGDPDVSVTLSMNTATTTVSSTVLYTLSYTNSGTIDAPSVVLSATVPSGTQYLAASSTGSWSCADGAVAFSTCTSSVGTVALQSSGSRIFAVRESFEFPFQAGTGANVLHNYTVTSSIGITAGTSNGADTNQNNNTATSSLLLTMIPLSDMGTAVTYRGFSGGLYPNATNTMPTAHSTQGSTVLASIQPLDTSGNPSSTGKIGMVSIGMSNTTQEFCIDLMGFSQGACNSWSFMGQASSSPLVNTTTLRIVNGARGGQSSEFWISPTANNTDNNTHNNYVDWVLPRIQSLGMTEAQIQVAWLKVAPSGNTTTLIASSSAAYTLEADLGNIVRSMKTRYPNLKQIFLSSRTFSYDPSSSSISGVGVAFETGYAVKFLIEAQINQMANSGTVVDGRAGDLNYSNGTAPWLSWGPYLWANGPATSSQGIAWTTSDVESDNIHPNQSGETKVGTALLNFFLNSPYTTWFRNS